VALREYKCECGNVFEELISGEYPKTYPCPECGKLGEYRFGLPIVRIPFTYGWDPGAGKYFDSQRQRDTHLDKNNLVKVPDGAYDQAFGEKVKA